MTSVHETLLWFTGVQFENQTHAALDCAVTKHRTRDGSVGELSQLLDYHLNLFFVLQHLVSASMPPQPVDSRELGWRNTISDQRFQSWLFGGAARIVMLKESLHTPRPGCFNIGTRVAAAALNC